MILRDARAGDVPAILAIYAPQVLTSLATFEEVPPSEAEMLGRFEGVRAAGLPYLVAEEAGTILGYAYATGWRARPAYRHTVEDSVYVAPTAQGRGVGAALLSTLVRRCEAGPWRQMIAVIARTGTGGSQALHARCGFSVAGCLRGVGVKQGREIDTVLMQRALAATD